MKKKKVMIIHSLYYPDIIGGAEISTQILAESLNEEYDVSVITVGSHNSETWVEEIINGVKIYRLPYSNIYWFGEVNREKSIIDKIRWRLNDIYNLKQTRILKVLFSSEKPDLIHSQNLPGISVAVWDVAYELDIPIVHTLRDFSLLDPVSLKLYDVIYANFTRKHSFKVNSVIGITYNILQKHTDNRFFSNSKKYVVPNAVHFNHVVDCKSMKEISDGSLHVGYFGQLKTIKGVDNLINAVKDLDYGIVKKLSIYGEGSDFKYFTELASGDSRIEFYGKIPKELVAEEMKKVDIIVVPSVWEEPFGRVIIESYQVGTPVIASNIGGIPEVIYKPEDSLFRKNSVEGIKEKIQIYRKKNLNERNELSIQVYKHSQNFSTENLYLRHKEIYNSVLTKVEGI